MAKGLGAILAEAEMAARQARLEKGLSLPCPLCGREMEFNGAVWVCRATRDARGWPRSCIYGDDTAFEKFIKSGGGFPDDWWRGTIVAAVVDENDHVLVTARVVRGSNGIPAITASCEDWDDHRSGKEPAYWRKFGWKLIDWLL